MQTPEAADTADIAFDATGRNFSGETSVSIFGRWLSQGKTAPNHLGATDGHRSPKYGSVAQFRIKRALTTAQSRSSSAGIRLAGSLSAWA